MLTGPINGSIGGEEEEGRGEVNGEERRRKGKRER